MPRSASALRLAAAVVALGCSSSPTQSCPTPRPAPQCIYDRMQVDPRSVATWSALGHSPGASAVGDGQPCTLQWSPLDVAVVPGEGTVATDHYLIVTCTDGDVTFEFDLGNLGDPRTWPDAKALPGPCTLHSGVTASGSPGQCEANSICGAVITIAVEQRAGGAGAPPNAVTPDYARTYRIDIDASHATYSSGRPLCDAATTTFVAHLWLTQTAADWAPADCMTICE